MDKTYEGRIRLGVVTDTDDLDGTVLEERPVGDCGAGRIEAAISEFRGEIEQTPPAVSAVKVGGERLYKKARRGENVVAPPRRVTIHDLEVTGLEPPDVLFRLRCSRGTYARSIARDLGEKLGCGGALASLRRTQVGVHRVEDAAPLAKLKGPQDVVQALRPLENALTLPVAIISGEFRNRVLSGNALAPEGLLAAPAGEAGDWVQIKLESGELLAVGQIVGGEEGRLVQPKRVLAA
jgi:tRNA pseudouridine55 synthase